MSKDEARTKGCWRVALMADDRLAAPAEAALERLAQSVSRFPENAEGAEPTGPWRIQALFDGKPDLAALAALLAEAAGRAGAPVPDFELEDLGEVDWLALNRRQFPPVQAGRFFIHGTHFKEAPPEGAIALRVDAGPAFGSGTHGSTRGCLFAIDRHAAGRPVARALDLGCGTGLLALAIAAATDAEVLATDVDPAAVSAAAANAEANGLGDRITVVLEGGVGEAVRARAPYDIVVANILAGPLMAMAADLRDILAPGGLLVLSGLLAREEKEVKSAFGGAGFMRARPLRLGEWATLVLSAGRRA